MRFLVSAVGTRGDVQPALALAVELRTLGHEVRLCLSPNFVAGAAALGFEAAPVGVEMRARPASPAKAPASAAATGEQARRPPATMPDLIADQFDALRSAAHGCDAILGAGGHQYAAPSIAEAHGVPYFNAVYAPVALPSPDLPPAPAPGRPWQVGGPAECLRLWAETARAWNARALEKVNDNRRRLGLAAVDDVHSHLRTQRPWLAADATLAPLPATPGLEVLQTGAWILADAEPLPRAVEEFLAAGDPPVYLGFGSMPVAPDAGRTLVAAARAVGRRAIVGQGWAELELADDGPDRIAVGDVNHQALFARVAAVVHHGGAGTTTSAARAGVPQVVAPMFSDQFYWASRVRALGIGAALPGAAFATEALAAALDEALRPATAATARAVGATVAADGAAVAARRLVAEVPAR